MGISVVGGSAGGTTNKVFKEQVFKSSGTWTYPTSSNYLTTSRSYAVAVVEPAVVVQADSLLAQIEFIQVVVVEVKSSFLKNSMFLI